MTNPDTKTFPYRGTNITLEEDGMYWVYGKVSLPSLEEAQMLVDAVIYGFQMHMKIQSNY